MIFSTRTALLPLLLTVRSVGIDGRLVAHGSFASSLFFLPALCHSLEFPKVGKA